MNRRRLLLLSSASLAAGLHPFTACAADDFTDLDARRSRARAAREVTPAELLEASITRIEAFNPKLNAIVTLLYERARSEARRPLPVGPFRGVPYALKDLVDLQGTRRTSGSRLLADHVSTETSEIVARSMQAGLVILGKTNTPEFALNATTEPLLFGPTHNPWDLARSAGGSSGGAAAAVAAGLLPFAHASDGGGSIRIPASCCGLFGFKPSRGRMTGSRASDSGVEHCVSRSVRDSARLFAWNQRQDAQAPLPPSLLFQGLQGRRLKIGFSTANVFGDPAAPAVSAALEESARLCASMGHHVEPARLPVEGDEFFAHFMVAWSGGADRMRRIAEAQGKKPEAVLEPWTLHLSEHFRRQPADAGTKAAAYFGELTRCFDAFFETCEVMLTPVLHEEPPPLGFLGPQVPGDRMFQRLLQYVSYTPMHNVAGTPAMSVPLGWSPAGLPIGSQFAARIGNEQVLFALAFELEHARPWAQRKPTAFV